jgi:cysteine desulfurase
MRKPIYLDYHATTPCDPRVVEAMLPYFTEHFANPSSPHSMGRRAAHVVEIAREQVAQLIGAEPEEIVFTSGATESNNLAILGVARAYQGHRRKVICSAIEHKSVLKPMQQLTREGYEHYLLPVDSRGRVRLDLAETLIDDQTLLVSVQIANQEIGTIQPIRSLAEIAKRAGAMLHCDAAQAVGKIPLNVRDLGVDFLSLSGHKMYGPKGIGALYSRRGVHRVEPLWYGGGQEGGLRSGTLNTPAIVGLGVACAISQQEMHVESARLQQLRDRLEQRLMQAISGLVRNGDVLNRLPHNSNLTFPAGDAEMLLARLPQLALSTLSACSAGTVEPSHVLLAIGLSREEAYRTLRVGVGRFTTEQEIDAACEAVIHHWLE